MGKYADIKDRIKSLRISHDMSQGDLASKIGVDKVAISQWERGVRKPRIELQQALCDVFNVNMDYLNGDWNHITRIVSEDEMIALDRNRKDPSFPAESSPIGSYKIPVVATIAAGTPIYSEGNIEYYIDYDKDPHGHVCGMHIKGDSMEPMLFNGDLVIVDEELSWENGDIVVVTVNGNDGACKRIQMIADGLQLISLNQAYAPIFYSKEEVEQLPVTVIGKVVESRRKF